MGLLKNLIRRIRFYTLTKMSIEDINSEFQTLRVQNWFRQRGDQTYRLNYNLNQNSVVFDVGGYKGEWANDIYKKYESNIYVFEPHPKFIDIIKKNTNQNTKIKLFEFGLGNVDQKIMLTDHADGSSQVNINSDSQFEVDLRSFSSFVKNNNIHEIDLIKINIEGAEYDLLDHILDNNLQVNIKNFQIQFHDFVDLAERRMARIQDRLEKTHKLTWQFPFVWENWKRIN